MTPAELDAYLARIGHTGSRSPTIETLRAVHFAQATSIPFENIDVLAGRGINIAPAAVQAKLVASRRGGYCFEHNRLLMDALVAMGFAVAGLLARVVWMQPPGTATARTHMLLRVDLDDGPWLADTGFGGNTQTGPIRLVPEIVQQTPHEPLRLIPHGAELRLEAELAGEWTPLYRFEESEAHQPDYEMGNWYTATHPQSIFTSNLLAARPEAGRRHALLNADYVVRGLDGEAERRRLDSVGELAEVLRDEFLVPLTKADIDAALAPRFTAWQAAPAR